MPPVLPAIALAFFLSATSLVTVLFRVSPLTATGYALSFFFGSLFIVVGSAITLVLAFAKGVCLHQSLRGRQVIGASLRQGFLIAAATCLVAFLFLLHILNWWIAGLVYAVFVLIEMAMGR